MDLIILYPVFGYQQEKANGDTRHSLESS